MEIMNLINFQEDLLQNIRKAEVNYKKSPRERLTQAYVETRLEMLEQFWKDFRDGHREIIGAITTTTDKEHLYFKDKIYDKCEEIYMQYKVILREKLHTFYSQQQTITSGSSTKEITTFNNCEVKLPRIQLPTFAGKYEEWQTFFDMFSTLIHNNKSLSLVQKLQYLKSNLTGEPQSLICNYTTTEANYEEAWNQLVRRYNNKRYNCTAVLKQLFAQKKITSESASAVKQLLDNTSSYLTSLKNMGIETDGWDIIIVFIVVSKLDGESVKQWEQRLSVLSDALPTWTQLREFLESRFRSMEMIDSSTIRAVQVQQAKTTARPKSFHAYSENKRRVYCAMCQDDHYIHNCEQFGLLKPKERQDFVQNNQLCFNCLAPSHAVVRCRSQVSCRKCKRRHHTLLHFDKVTTPLTESAAIPSEPKPGTSKDEVVVAANFSKQCSNVNTVLLATANVNVKSRNCCKYTVRTLIDQGSQATFITENTVQLLGLSRKSVNGWVSGLGDGRTKIKYMVSLSLESCHNSNNIVHVNAFVLKSLTSFLPAVDIDPLEWSEIEGLPLADGAFYSSGKIDLLLGAEVYSEILQNGVLKHPTRNLIAQNTILGWIISGRVSRKQHNTANSVISMHISLKSEDEILRQFWEMENEPQSLTREQTESEKKCEEYFDKTTSRDSDGRFVVRLPFSTDDPKCVYSNSKRIALKRLEFQEKKLLRNEELSKEYKNVMSEYLSLNHLVEVPESAIANTKSVYLPHHAVVRDDKTTTKVRVVFDASCKGDNSVALNDELLVGPKLQQDLRHILMRWRLHRVVVVADIVKMYRMILIAKDETDYQRLLWRFHPSDPVKHFKLLRLTFGTACAPYLAVKCLQRLAETEEAKYPVAAKITKSDYYIDDLISGADSTEEIIRIYEEMKQLMSCGGFDLQKWNSNDEEFLKYVSKIDDERHTTTEFKINNVSKVLGLGWNRSTDSFEYILNLPEQREYTKRQVVSDVARIYDPLGWIAPVIIVAKILIQSIWKSNLEWDDKLSENLMKEWIMFRSSLSYLKEIQVQRWVETAKIRDIQLHAFSDASKKGFAAAVYLRVKDEKERVSVHLITAKTKVAPLKEISIPRLELCGAVIAAKLISEVAQVLNVSKENLYGWTDSTIVLAWLKGGSSRWATFVSNRVTTILNILQYEQWGHVTSENNPADVASRGSSARDLVNDSLWWKGPSWLREGVVPTEVVIEDTTEEEKVKVLTALSNIEKEEEHIWSRFSNLQTTLKTISYCKRVLNFKLPKESRKHYPKFITAQEMEDALLLCVRQIQESEFCDEIKQLKTRGVVSKKSSLRTLCPIYDKNGILRVGGRISQSEAAYDVRHPIIIPAKGHFTRLIILDAHRLTLHGGPQVMLNLLRTKYWIIRAKTEVKRIYRGCVTCKRHSSKPSNQLMGQIPQVRLKPSKPFKSTGVDYAGPINIRFSPGRGAKSYKGYICLFVCMVTRAVHLEAVTDMSTKGFLAAFRRFTSRRGHCQDIYSDNGSNFVGADKVLKEMLICCKSSLSMEIAKELALEGTTWHFIPPYAPNFGGLWEAGVRSTKNHLHKVIGNNTLTYEELATVLTQVEACLNSRPISVISDNPNDPLPLTPGHFLVGESLINLADQDYCENVTGIDRWKLTQKIVRDFWNRWYKEYLVTLSQRFKWNCKTNEPNINAVVVLKEDNVPPAKWILGRIIEKHPGPDNITRVVTVKCKNGIYKRPLSKISVLCE